MFTRHSTPETRAAIRDHVAAQVERERVRVHTTRVIVIPLTPSSIVALTVSVALVAVGVVESLPL